MDDKKIRSISKETLEAILPSLNEDFISKLPATPEKLLEYATRRTDPVISNNVTYELGRKMLDMRLSDEEYLITFFRILADVFANKKSVQAPQAQILLAQTGAGKTKLRELIFRSEPNTVMINSDEYKKFRTDADKILQEDPVHFGALTGIDSYDHARNLVTFAVENSYNLLVEVAPSEKQGIVGVDLEQLQENGYAINPHVLAVGDLVSGLAIHTRYENDLRNRSRGAKLTDMNRHDESYRALETVLEYLLDLEAGKIGIYVRGKDSESLPVQIAMMEGQKETVMRTLRAEREKSNNEYVASGKFEEDYRQIRASMKQREASDLEDKQLARMHEKYELYFVKKFRGLEEK